jgi:hypothetical protein
LDSIFIESLGIRLTSYLVGIIEKFSDPKILSLISDIYVKQALDCISDPRDVMAVSLKLLTIPSSVRLKAATESLSRFL